MKIWITGSAGFLGTRLAQQLTGDGHDVFGLSRRQSEAAIAQYQLDLASPTSIPTIKSLVEKDGSPDVVIHTASRQPGLKGELREYVASNLTTTSNLLEALRDSPPRQIIYTSTLSVYGRTSKNPVAEDTPAGGSLPYSATKRWAEQVVENGNSFSNRVVLRLPSLFGKGQEDSFIDGLARVALRNEPLELFSRGELVRDALHVSDVVTAIQSCVQAPPQADFVCLNLGCGRSITTNEWTTALVAALGSKSSITPLSRPGRQFDMYADIKHAQEIIGFCPTELRESMNRYAAELRT